MQKINNKASKISKRGFTLLEIIIVVAIIAVLSVILLPRLARVRQPANDARRINDLRTIQGFLEIYYQKNRYYPPNTITIVGYGDLADITNCAAATTLCGILVTDGSASSLPNDPVSGSIYEYGADAASDAQSYVLGATLQQSSNPVLSGDVDGSVYSVDCDDSTYCIQF